MCLFYKKGYVNVQAISKEGIKGITTPQYISKTVETIKKLVKNGYDQADIAILVRKKEQATEIGNEMIKEGFNISSSESMLVNNSIKVQLIIAILYLSSNPNSSRHHKTIFDILYELSDRKIQDYHQFAIKNLNVKTSIFFSQLEINFGLIFFPPFTKGAYADVKFINVVSAAPKDTESSSGISS